MKYSILILLVTFISFNCSNKKNNGALIKTEEVQYTANGIPLKGFLSYDENQEGLRPGIIVVHEWWGNNDYSKRRAEMLAKLGYIALAIDMYGNGKQAHNPSDAGKFAAEAMQNMDEAKARFDAGVNFLKEQSQTDTNRIAAIGYCFGGSTVQQLAYSGADLKAIVSFHGGLINPPAKASDLVKASFLICHGADDPFVTEQDLQKYLSLMKATSLDWEMIIYGGAKHSFTNPDADKAGMEALKYNPVADRRSWAQMKLFFNEFFSSPKKK